ncbi:MAG: phytoene/squalene synthase family protein [Pirellulaceae bacterium]
MKRPSLSIDDSFAAASQIARHSASSFYPSFWLLPRPKRLAMCAFYAFARLTDDVADASLPIEQKLRWLKQWKEQIAHALPAQDTEHPSVPESQIGFAEAPDVEAIEIDKDFATQANNILPALAQTQRNHQIPVHLFLELIDGSIADQQPVSIDRFSQLEDYCYLVASTVGLVCLHIWGFDGCPTRQAAIDCGKAFQLTNILRDVNEDRRRGRCYLAAEDLNRYGVDRHLTDASQAAAWRALLSDYCQRADSFYLSGWDAYDGIHPDGQPMFSMMWHSYRELLLRIQRDPTRVLQRRLRLSWPKKLRIATKYFGPLTVRKLLHSLPGQAGRS